jgi:hypothetical protein
MKLGRKLGILLFLVYTTFFVVYAQQPSPPDATFAHVYFPLLTSLPPVTQANVAIVGNPGTSTYRYWLVANYTFGQAPISHMFKLSNAPTVLSGSNYVSVTPVYPLGATVDLLRTTGDTPPSGTGNYAVSTGNTSGAILDQGGALTSYTVAPISPVPYGLCLSNQVTGAAAGHLILGVGPPDNCNTLVADLSLAGAGGSITGGGTGAFLPEWTGAGASTALGNSPILDLGVITGGINYALAGGKSWQIDASHLSWNTGIQGSSNIIIANTFNPGGGNNAGGVVIQGAPTSGSACAGGVSLQGGQVSSEPGNGSITVNGGCQNGFGAIGMPVIITSGIGAGGNGNGYIELNDNTGTFIQSGGAATESGNLTISSPSHLTLAAMSGTSCLEEISGVVTATGSACGAGAGTINTAAQYSTPYYSAAGTASTLSGAAPPTANGTYVVGYVVSGGVAVPPTISQVGVGSRAVLGTTSTDTILYSDNTSRVAYQGSVAVATSLPTPTTLGNSTFAVRLTNNTTGSSTAVTVTPTTLQINGASTLVIPQKTSCLITVDVSGSFWNTDCSTALPIGVAVGSQLASNGASQPPVYQTKPAFDARDYGVTGNGTTDDTTAMQNAINAACNTGGFGSILNFGNQSNVVLKITSTLTVSKCAGMTIDGGQSQGQATTGAAGGANSGNTIIEWYGATGGTVLEINQTRDSVFRNFTVFTNATSYTAAGANTGILIDEIGTVTNITTNNHFENIQVYNGNAANSNFIGINICPTAPGNCEEQNFDRLNIGCGFASPVTSTNTGTGIKYAGGQPFYTYLHWSTVVYCSTGIDVEAANVLDLNGGLMGNNYTDLYVNGGRGVSYRHFRSENGTAQIVIGNASSSSAHDLTIEENSFAALTASTTTISFPYTNTGGIIRLIKNDWDTSSTVTAWGPTGSGAFVGTFHAENNHYPSSTLCPVANLGSALRFELVHEDCNSGTGVVAGGSSAGNSFQSMPEVFADLPACAAATEGAFAAISDSTTNSLGATITGSGTNHVLGYCNKTNWIVAAGVGAVTFPLTAPSGTAGAPSYSFSSSTNSGMFYDSGPAFSSGGTEYWRLLSGLLEIGSASGGIIFNTSAGFGGTWTGGFFPTGTVGLFEIGNSTSANALGGLKLAVVQAGLLYSAAGTALPTCGSGLNGERAVVSDATSPSYMTAYASGGAITTEVICSFNGTTYTWLTH